jgi:hypothetical protein
VTNNMAQSWKYAVLLGLVGVATAAGCTVTDGDDDGFAGDAGEGGDSGSGGTGGSAGKGGTGGTAGKGGTGGTAGKGGAAGAAGKAGSGGTAGTTAGTGGGAGDSGSGGEGGDDGGPVTCDPDEGNLVSTPYDTCEPEDDDDECGACIQENCCEESKKCYGYDPKNVCGWGGPEGLGEIDCYESCLTEYVTGAEGVCDDDGIFGCLNACATEACGVIAGNQTTELAACMNANCPSECFGADSCEE